MILSNVVTGSSQDKTPSNGATTILQCRSRHSARAKTRQTNDASFDIYSSMTAANLSMMFC